MKNRRKILLAVIFCAIFLAVCFDSQPEVARDLVRINVMTYEPEDICSVSDIKVDRLMYYCGELSMIDQFITWAVTTENDIVYTECVKAFKVFKYYPKDLETAKALLPSDVVRKIVKIHEKTTIFPEGVKKSDF